MMYTRTRTRTHLRADLDRVGRRHDKLEGEASGTWDLVVRLVVPADGVSTPKVVTCAVGRREEHGEDRGRDEDEVEHGDSRVQRMDQLSPNQRGRWPRTRRLQLCQN